MKFEIGDAKPSRAGAPAWESVWPVLVDGKERAEIVERERGYQLRQVGVWVTPQRPFRSEAADDARNLCLTWQCTVGHPASGTRYEETEINGETWSRVTVEGVVTYGPERGTEGMHAEYRRLYDAFLEGVERDTE